MHGAANVAEARSHRKRTTKLLLMTLDAAIRDSRQIYFEKSSIFSSNDEKKKHIFTHIQTFYTINYNTNLKTMKDLLLLLHCDLWNRSRKK